MSLGFFVLGVGVVAMLLSCRGRCGDQKGRIGCWWFVAIGIALFGAGIFYPYPTPNLASYLHALCGVIVIVTFPIAATFYSAGLAHRQGGTISRERLRMGNSVRLAGILSFAGSTIVLGIISQPMDRSNPNLLIGWQNRFMIV